MLPICLGEATKLSGFLLDADKVYRVRCKLGETTTTGDAEGEVLVSATVPSYSDIDIETVLAEFRGEIEQTPPMYSALHHNGRRLYELARAGVEVERPSRRLHIRRLVLLDRDGGGLHLEVHCSKGTYVRTLVTDIGDALGCGAHVSALRRLGVEPYLSHEMLTFEVLEERLGQGQECLDQVIQGADSAVGSWPRVRLNDDMTHFVRHGQPVLVPRAPANGWVRIYQGDTSFIGVGEIDDSGRVAPRRIFQY
jgi:tRNA pseudouridine55 synthase